MAVDADTVRQMAKLARLDIRDAALEKMAAEMDLILGFMGQIAEWEGHPDTTQTAAYRRPDVEVEGEANALITAAADHAEGQVVVPPIKGAS